MQVYSNYRENNGNISKIESMVSDRTKFNNSLVLETILSSSKKKKSGVNKKNQPRIMINM